MSSLYTSWNEVNGRLLDEQGNPIDSFSTKPFLPGQLWDALDKECHPSGQEVCVDDQPPDNVPAE